MRESARPSSFTSTCCRFRKKRLGVPFQLNRVRVKRRRASCKNTTVLNHRHTSFFSPIEFVRSRALAGCESSNERKRNGCHSKAPTSWTPEFVGLKVRQTSHEAPSQDGESASPPGTPWIHPGEVSGIHSLIPRRPLSMFARGRITSIPHRFSPGSVT